MNIIGIIIEANPFHNGHQYFINKIKNDFSPDVIIALTTTSFTMRGEISVIDKFSKTQALLDAGANLVLEFPFVLATQSSDYFSINALSILNQIGINQLICGCETDDESILQQFYQIEQSEIFKTTFKENLKKYTSYKKTFSITLSLLGIDQYLIDLFNQPNFTLSYQYYKTIRCCFPHIKLKLIKRTNHYDDLSLSYKIVSAKAIRQAIINQKKTNKYVPFQYQYTNIIQAEQQIFNLLQYQLLIKNYNNKLIDKEGTIYYLRKNISNCYSYSELINKTINKRYTKARINRTILYIVHNVKQFFHQIPYLRILGFDQYGINYLHIIPKAIKSLIFSSINEIDEKHLFYNIATTEIKSTTLFAIITNNNKLIENEYKLPIRKKE